MMAGHECPPGADYAEIPAATRIDDRKKPIMLSATPRKQRRPGYMVVPAAENSAMDGTDGDDVRGTCSSLEDLDDDPFIEALSSDREVII